MEQPPQENEQDRIAIANRAEELMLRTRQVARRMKDRLWKAMKLESLPGPHVNPPQAILVAEGDPTVRDLLEFMVERLGYQVWLAADGLEALDLYLRHQEEIGAVVLDVHMPRFPHRGG